MTDKKKADQLKEKYQLIKTSLISEPDAPIRGGRFDDGVKELADSIKLIGLIEPLVVKKVKERFEVIAGHRRLIACRLAKLNVTPCIVVDESSYRQDQIKMHENKFRKDLSDIEEARYFQYLVHEKGMKNKDIAEMMNVSESFVSQHLTILSWIPELIEAVDQRKISFTSARELNRVKDIPVLRGYILHAVRHGITPSVANGWYQQWLSMKSLADEESQRVVGESPTTPPETPMYKCHFCNEVFEFDETLMVRVCPECLETTAQIIKMERRMSK